MNTIQRVSVTVTAIGLVRPGTRVPPTSPHLTSLHRVVSSARGPQAFRAQMSGTLVTLGSAYDGIP